MTTWIKKALVSVALLGSVFVTPVLADGPVCARGAFETFRPALETGGVTITEVPQVTVDMMVEKKGGPPPGIEEGDAFTMMHLHGPQGDQLVSVDKNGCVTWATPVMPAASVNKFLGLVEA